MTILRKSIQDAKPGDRFRWNVGQETREVVRVRRTAIPLPPFLGGPHESVDGVEIMHRALHRPGVDYLEAPSGAQLAILIP